jgi:hypothetical protein
VRPEQAEIVYISVTEVLQRCEEQRSIAHAEAMSSQVVVIDACAHPEVDEGSLENDEHHRVSRVRELAASQRFLTAESPASES